MKLLKKLLVTLTAVMICLVPLFGSVITVHAEGPVTYIVKYVSEDGDWFYQADTWTDDGSERELYYMLEKIKDGDLLVIDGAEKIELAVDVQLENLTVVHSTTAIITAKGINNCYVINDSVAAINADVTYAAVYDKSAVNFNNNVGTLELLSEKYEDLNQSVSVIGTVNHLKASDKNELHYEFYNFAENTLRIEEGELTTDKAKYSETPVAPTPAPTAAPSTPSAPAADTSSNEYDDVPKTGDARFNPLWLVAIAAVCLMGSYELKRKY